MSLILPSMSAHLKSLGASYFLIGGMTSIYACTQLISGPIIVSIEIINVKNVMMCRIINFRAAGAIKLEDKIYS